MGMAVTLAALADLLKPWATATRISGDSRLDVDTTVESLLPAISALNRARWGFLSAITSLDYGAVAKVDSGAASTSSGASSASGGARAGSSASALAGSFEILYHFCNGPLVLTFRVKLPRGEPSVPTVSIAVPSALMFEREIVETMGIKVAGMPDRKRQFLSDDWPDNQFPLRKDFSLDAMKALIKDAPLPVVQPERDATFIVPIGPQHPALKEPGHFELAVDGEIVTAAAIRLGYAHRGIEKAAEDRLWIHNIYLMERICGICSHIHATAYALGVEKLAGVTAPPRAQAIRTIFAEMERIHSHLLWMGVSAHEAGFDTLFMYSWRDRETIMKLLEEISGNRVNYSVNLLGGVKYDINAKGADVLRRGLDYLEKRTHKYLKIVTTDESFLRRTRGVGAVTYEQADSLGTVGPTARASGVARDLRVDAPYMAYTDFPVKTVIDTRCDLEARFVVRINELFESFRLIREILGKLPPGDLAVAAPRRVSEGEVISRVEAPRGELFYYIRSTGGTKPDRVKVRTPSLCNWAAVVNVLVGHKLADVPMIIVGIDPCFSCNDRAITLRRGGGTESWSWEELRRHGIRYYGGRVA